MRELEERFIDDVKNGKNVYFVEMDGVETLAMEWNTFREVYNIDSSKVYYFLDQLVRNRQIKVIYDDMAGVKFRLI